MAASLPMIAYLDHELVDELWTLLKKNGVPTTEVQKAVTKVSAQAKFGLGKLIGFLATDLETTVSGGVDTERALTLTHTAQLRLLFLLELLPDLQRARQLNGAYIDGLSVGAFVDVSNEAYEMTQIPRMSDYMLISMLDQMRDASDSGASQDEYTVDTHMKVISLMEKFTSQQRAMTFHHRASDRQTSLGKFHEGYEAVLDEMLSISQNDYVVGIAHAAQAGDLAAEDILAVSLFRENSLNKTVSPFAAKQRSRLFGRLVSKGSAPNGYGPRMVAIQPVALLFD